MIDKTVTKVLNKLFESGYCNEKDIINLKIDDLIIIGCFSMMEIEVIVKLKEAVKNNKIISFMSGNTHES